MMDQSMSIDEVAQIESLSGLSVMHASNLRDVVLSNAWASLLSTRDKRAKYAALEKSIRKYNSPFGGIIENFYVYQCSNDDVDYNRSYEVVNHSLSSLASKLKMPITYTASDADTNGIMIIQFKQEQWNEIPDSIAQEMLEEIEQKLHESPISVVYFFDFVSSSMLIRSFASRLIEQANICVYLDGKVDTNQGKQGTVSELFTSTPPLYGNNLFSCVLEPVRFAQMTNRGQINELR